MSAGHKERSGWHFHKPYTTTPFTKTQYKPHINSIYMKFKKNSISRSRGRADGEIPRGSMAIYNPQCQRFIVIF